MLLLMSSTMSWFKPSKGDCLWLTCYADEYFVRLFVVVFLINGEDFLSLVCTDEFY